VSQLVVLDDAFSHDEVRAFREGALASPFLGESPLKGTFEATRGFSVTFQRRSLDDVRARFPFLAPFFARATDRALHKRAQRRPRFFPVVEPNAFYLNVLVVPPGAGVERHVDATLSPHEQPDSLIPIAVAVAYAQVPADLTGGALVLDDGKPLPAGFRAEVLPKEGRFVMFAGHLAHRVADVACPSGLPRVSWVLEQYALDDATLATIRALRVHSRAGFAAFLADAKARSTPDM
jgi:hypothetical protein